MAPLNYLRKATTAIVFGLVCSLSIPGLRLLGSAKKAESGPDNSDIIVINTWSFSNATEKARKVLEAGGSALDAVEQGCSQCEIEQCDGTVGYGGSPDESGETTLDAMIMDGRTIDAGAVAALRRVKSAISVARAVMSHTKHTILAGDQATQFAVEMGFPEEDLGTGHSKEMWKNWTNAQCQPNYRQNVTPDPTKSCGPYTPKLAPHGKQKEARLNRDIGPGNHDTIGMVVIDGEGTVAVGTSSNGANHKVPGRVGDAPIVGAGAYANELGGAAATGDGDVMMRFLPSFQVVQYLLAVDPTTACELQLAQIAKYYPEFNGAIVAASASSKKYGAACHSFSHFEYSVYSSNTGKVEVKSVKCTYSK